MNQNNFMSFYFDQQTNKDLDLFNIHTNDNIFNYFNKTKTNGGKEYLFDLMHLPTSDFNLLQKRKNIITSIQNSNFDISIEPLQFDFIDTYLKSIDFPPSQNSIISRYRFYSYKIKPNNSYYIISKGIENILYLLKELQSKRDFFSSQQLLQNEYHIISKLLKEKNISKYLNLDKFKNSFDFMNLDYFFRIKYQPEITTIIEFIYQLDAYISIAKTANTNNLHFAKYENSATPTLELEQFSHPLLKNAVPYDFKIKNNQNLCFLTGPNMAGKSTFLKALGICVYLSHIGFPLPASSCKISILSGITTTINISDNLSRGYSHFYSEVKRVKETALQLKEHNNMLIIFDELFRGTNVKDAYDASLAIIKSLANNKNSIFFISTHITEIANELKNQQNINFKCFSSQLINDQPQYNFQLQSGVCKERMGMHIIENERILEILNSVK